MNLSLLETAGVLILAVYLLGFLVALYISVSERLWRCKDIGFAGMFLFLFGWFYFLIRLLLDED